MTLYADIDLRNIGSGNGLLSGDTKPLPKPMLINNQFGSVALPRDQFQGMILKNTLLKLLPHLIGAKGLFRPPRLKINDNKDGIILSMLTGKWLGDTTVYALV